MSSSHALRLLRFRKNYVAAGSTIGITTHKQVREHKKYAELHRMSFSVRLRAGVIDTAPEQKSIEVFIPVSLYAYLIASGLQNKTIQRRHPTGLSRHRQLCSAYRAIILEFQH